MVLTIQIPMEVTVFYGKYRNRMSAVTDLVPLLTSVRAVRLIRVDGVLDEAAVEVDAFIPKVQRRHIEGSRSKWIDSEYRRSIAYIQDNKKTLATFLASGDEEWDLRKRV
jgi:hypothetical protein